jgi:hypothetical protein
MLSGLTCSKVIQPGFGVAFLASEFVSRDNVLAGAIAGGPPFETVLVFRVAAPSRVFEGAEGLAFSLG